MRGLAFLSCLGALLAATVSAASIDAGQIQMGVGARTNSRYAPSHPGSYLETDDARAAAAGSAQAQLDALLTSSSGLGGPARVELPLDAISTAAFGSAKAEQIIASQKGEFTVLTHRDFPSVAVRIKQLYAPPPASELKGHDVDPDAFCDPTVTSWSGYIDTAYGGKSLWFYFFESRSDPAKDPVILWTNGGPGCSSSLGLFMELGPCRIPENGGKLSPGPPINGTRWHPQSWTNRANVFFIDQPVGVGYSYSKTEQKVYTTEEAARDVYAFLRVFFSAFDRFRSNDFYMAGESYGGRYIPIFASEVADRNHDIERAALKAGKKPSRDELINLKGVLIGNGLTDVSKQMSGYYDMTCTRRGGVAPILSIDTCKRMANWVPKCRKLLAEHCVESYNPDACDMWTNKCSRRSKHPISTPDRTLTTSRTIASRASHLTSATTSRTISASTSTVMMCASSWVRHPRSRSASSPAATRTSVMASTGCSIRRTTTASTWRLCSSEACVRSYTSERSTGFATTTATTSGSRPSTGAPTPTSNPPRTT